MSGPSRKFFRVFSWPRDGSTADEPTMSRGLSVAVVALLVVFVAVTFYILPH